ncbi:MAG: cyclic nucleotide-binding domain-containing protein [Candidatus Ozemobacteraceae bacterium]
MQCIPLISSRPSVISLVEKLIRENDPDDPTVPVLQTTEEAGEFLNLEMPEVFIIDMSDPDMKPWELVDTILADPWLLHGGMIPLCDDAKTTERVEKIPGGNIIVAVRTSSLENGLPRIIRILQNNRRILFQRQIGSDLVKNISGSFRLANDFLEAQCYARLVGNFLYNSGRLDLDQRQRLSLCLEEMLYNAIEHGNCGISYSDKSLCLDDGKSIIDLVREKCQDPVIADRMVTFEYAIDPENATFLVADEGNGFNWRALSGEKIPVVELASHGRGILLTQAFVKDLTFNERGNEVHFRIEYQEAGGHITPGLFKNLETIDVFPGEIIFQQGDPSSFLYYIVKGQFDVFANGELISTLTPDDMFMGEMSFLLDNHRSATVQSRIDGRLIRITKRDFVQGIKRRPHYGLLLCRLLARRIERLNVRRLPP